MVFAAADDSAGQSACFDEMVEWDVVIDKVERWVGGMDQASREGDWPKVLDFYADARDELARSADLMQEFLDRCGPLLGTAGGDQLAGREAGGTQQSGQVAG